MIRVLLDANVLASAAVAVGKPTSTVARVVSVVIRECVLVLPDEVVNELERTLLANEWFRKQIPVSAAQTFIATLAAAAHRVTQLSEAAPRICRDPRDDFLLAHAAAADCDFLVTGDRDLLALANLDWPFQLVTPAQFIAAIETGR